MVDKFEYFKAEMHLNQLIYVKVVLKRMFITMGEYFLNAK